MFNEKMDRKNVDVVFCGAIGCAEAEFFQWLVEDRSPGGMSYVEFLIHVHRIIQNKMAL